MSSTATVNAYPSAEAAVDASAPIVSKRKNTVSSLAQSVQSTTLGIASDVLNRDPPPGFFAAAAGVASHAPTVGEIRRGSFGPQGWQTEGQRRDRRMRAESALSGRRRLHSNSFGKRNQPILLRKVHTDREDFPAMREETIRTRLETEPFPELDPSTPVDRDLWPELPQTEMTERLASASSEYGSIKPVSQLGKVYSSGYIPAPVIPWTTTFAVGFKAFLKWVATPFGLFWTVYALNVVAWGGMLFLLLINASPAMCWAPIPSQAPIGQPTPVDSLRLIQNTQRYYNCNDIFSPRRIWLEIDSQILNALFCVTGFGLFPWRFRDLWYLMQYRLTNLKRHGLEQKMYGLRKLAGHYSTWFRLPDSNTLDILTSAQYEEKMAKTTPHSAAGHRVRRDAPHVLDSEVRIPLPLSKTPPEPLSGVRAHPTSVWKMDLFVWCQIGNTAFQIVLCGFMWGLNRFNRPSWATGLFIALACIIAGIGGIVSYLEGRKVKRVEGVQAQATSKVTVVT